MKVVRLRMLLATLWAGSLWTFGYVMAPTLLATLADRILAGFIAGMLACTVVGYFGLQPFMAALKEGAAGGMMDPEARSRFGLLHGVASVFYFIQSLLGGFLVWKLRYTLFK